ncbi:MAG: hypothetical protein D8M58_04185 [Calditrichaeota bacterium]|nr:MAG: hypothetical protein DWQ03_02890 [Calditrichota bacterium]MBL1204568.1 hypothetical protein [Calditrichota bacterium]NOG44397.1 hypothetical protein [Calditrichota bacterium]
MWSIIKSEIQYQNSKIILILSLALPFIIFLNYRYNGVSSFWAIWLTFMLVQNWISLRHKDKRDYLINCLPISRQKIGWSRLLIVFIYTIAVTLIFSFIYIISIQIRPDFTFSILMPIAISLLGFSFYFILRDTLLNFFRKKGITQQKLIVSLTIAGISLNLITVYVFIKTTTEGAAPFGIGSFFQWIENHNPFFYQESVYITLILAGVISLFTTISYNYKKAFKE